MNHYQFISRLLKPHIPNDVERWEIIWRILDLVGESVETALLKYAQIRGIKPGETFEPEPHWLRSETRHSWDTIARRLDALNDGIRFTIERRRGKPPLVTIHPAPDENFLNRRFAVSALVR